jgi:DMSO/TMAO reductase YedYZ molybdopterin-dependent catalytic subunit
MKHLTSLNVVTEPFKGFWMATAYRIPKGKFAVVDRFLSQESDTTTPITEMVVNSLITNVRDGSVLPGGKPIIVRGVAWDGGFGMRLVEVSLDGGKSWREADLGPDLGRYAWRQWSFPIASPRAGDQYTVLAKATNRIGGSQTFELVFNPAGYHNNVVQPVNIKIA